MSLKKVVRFKRARASGRTLRPRDSGKVRLVLSVDH